MLEIGAVGKDGKNQDQRYEYTSAAAVMAAAQKALARHGLRISSTSAITDVARYTTKAGNEGTRVTMRTTVTISDGEQSISADGWGCGQDTQDKAPMKAQTASYKYALSAALCIGFGDDPEADEEANDGGPKAEATRKRQPEKASAGELLALCKTPTELNLWCGIHGEQVQALKGEAKRTAWAQVKARATAIGVSEEQVLAWLTGAPESEEAFDHSMSVNKGRG
jgi:hypothetical protein